jgi:hypothetical protein
MSGLFLHWNQVLALLAKQASVLEHQAGEARNKRLAALLELARRGGDFS